MRSGSSGLDVMQLPSVIVITPQKPLGAQQPSISFPAPPSAGGIPGAAMPARDGQLGSGTAGPAQSVGAFMYARRKPQVSSGKQHGTEHTNAAIGLVAAGHEVPPQVAVVGMLVSHEGIGRPIVPPVPAPVVPLVPAVLLPPLPAELPLAPPLPLPPSMPP
jgi:hypothetical protein